MHVVTRGHFRLREKDGDHIIRSAMAENPMLHANFKAVCEPELLPIEVLHCENRDFRLFGFCDLDLDPVTFIYDLDLYPLDIHRMRENEYRILRRGFRESSYCRQTDKQTDRHTQWLKCKIRDGGTLHSGLGP